MKCVKCGFENQEGIVNCVNCGTVLSNINLTNNNVGAGAGVLPSTQSNVQTAMYSQDGTGDVLVNVQSTTNGVVGSINNVVVNEIGTVHPVGNNSDISALESGNQTGGNQPKKGKLKLLLGVLIVVLVLVIVLAVVVFIRGQNILKEREELLENRIEIIWTPSDNNYSIGSNVTLVDNSVWRVVSKEGDMLTLFSSSNYDDEEFTFASYNSLIEEQFLPELKNSLSSNGGDISNLSARIISIEDIREVMGVLSTVSDEEITFDSNYHWLYETGAYWITKGENDYCWIEVSPLEYGIDCIGTLQSNNQKEAYIRPVIEVNVSNVKK